MEIIPPQYLAAAAVAVLRGLDGVIRLIPDRFLAAHPTEAAGYPLLGAVFEQNASTHLR